MSLTNMLGTHGWKVWSWRWWLCVLDGRSWRLQFQAYYHRATRGWSEVDAWNADLYLAEVIAGMCRWLADNSHGYPQNETPESWRQKLLAIADGFTAPDDICEWDEWDGPPAATWEALRAAFPHLWD